MTETAESVIDDTYLTLGVKPAEQPLEAHAFQQGVRFLNRMMERLDAEGVSLGFTVVSNPDDLITVSPGAIEGIIFNLAVTLAPSFSKIVTPELALNARDGMDAMLRLAENNPPARFPCTLPIGSGNEWRGSQIDPFYPCPEDSTLTEDNGNILLENDT